MNCHLENFLSPHLNVVHQEMEVELITSKMKLKTCKIAWLKLPQISLECLIFRPSWVRQNGTQYRNNNTYLITDSDGLDPIFSRLDDIMVVGGDISS